MVEGNRERAQLFCTSSDFCHSWYCGTQRTNYWLEAAIFFGHRKATVRFCCLVCVDPFPSLILVQPEGSTCKLPFEHPPLEVEYSEFLTVLPSLPQKIETRKRASASTNLESLPWLKPVVILFRVGRGSEGKFVVKPARNEHPFVKPKVFAGGGCDGGCPHENAL